MRRSILGPRVARGPIQTLLRRGQPRRGLMTPGTKNTTPPKPIEPSQEQAMPIGLYYESILKTPQPIPEKPPLKPPTPTTPEPEAPSTTPRGRKPKAPKSDAAKASSLEPSLEPSLESSLESSPPTPTPAPNNPQDKVRVIFGSRLAGPAERAERLAAIKNRSQMIAGVLVPPKPDEPDNCCMSGCVNCVWDLYRDDMEEWAAANKAAERHLRAQEAGVGTTEDSMATRPEIRVGDRELDHGAVSVDDDGGGTSGNWDVGNIAGQGAGTKLSKDFWDEELYQNIPVGIREFMKQEKRLKERHMREGTVGG